MKKIWLFNFLIWIAFIFCSPKKRVEINSIVTMVNFSIKDLYGTWANSKIEKTSNTNNELRLLFRPISGFTISKDTAKDKYRFKMQYYEQEQAKEYDSLFFLRDSIMGNIADEIYYIGKISMPKKKIYDFKLIDYGVFSEKVGDNKEIEFTKYTDCILSCSIESFIIDDVTTIFPITVVYNSNRYDIQSTRRKCSCYGEIIGFKGYSSYQIIDIVDNNSIQIAFYNIEKQEFEFFKLERNKNNILTKLD
jgi:hypothetical protein